MNLIPEWKSALKFASVQLAGYVSILSGVALANQNTLLSLLGYMPTNGWARGATIVAIMLLIFIVPAALRVVQFKAPPSA